MEFSIELKQRRENAKLSQEELAEKLGVSKRTVSSWETGENNPQPKMKRKIDQLFGEDATSKESILEIDRTVIIEALLRNTLKQIAIDRADRQDRDLRDILREIDAGTVEEMNKIALRLEGLKG